MKYDYLIVGAGLYGATVARQLTDAGKSVLVIDKRDHIAGNVYTEKVEGINFHKYGAHIFHTNNSEVWNYVQRFATFNRFTNSPVANYKGELCFAKVRNSNTTLITEELSHLDINHGVDIDIYPLIHLADDKNDRKIQYRNTMLFMLLRYDEPPRNHGKVYYYGGKIILGLIPKFIKKKLEQKFERHVLTYQHSKTKDVYVVNGNIEVMRQDLNSEWFSSAIDHPFESNMFSIPIGAKQWLSKRYGSNYMEPPKKEFQGIKLEGFVKIDLEKPYTYYKGKYYCLSS